jgi:RNA polymerase sigma factor (sigma-70 family)
MKGTTTPRKPTAPKINVLLVDDDPGVRESVGLALTEQGARVTPVASLDEARKNLSRKRFSLVLTDLCLCSGNEGLTVARLARRRTPDARVILFSGSDMEEVAEEAADAGVDEMIPKPLTIDVLARLLTDLGTEDPAPQPVGRVSERLTDEQGQALLGEYVDGSAPALDRIVAAYRPMLFSVFLKWFRLSTEDAEDLSQEVMLQLVLKAPEIRNVRTWLLGTAINQAKKRIRRLIRERNLAERYIENLELRAPEDSDDMREVVSKGLDLLRPSDQKLLTLIYIQGLSYQETASYLGRPIGSIGPLRGRALKRLTRAITELEKPPKEMVA